MAVGNDSDSTSGQNTRTFVETLTGTTWTLGTSVDPSPGENASLNGVSCPTQARCEAVGDFDLVPTQQTLVERFS